MLSYAILFVIESILLDDYTYSNAWIGLIIIVQIVFTFVYGRRITKSIGGYSWVQDSDREKLRMVILHPHLNFRFNGSLISLR